MFTNISQEVFADFSSELFGSLLGQRVRVDEDSENEEEVEFDGLRLFKS